MNDVLSDSENDDPEKANNDQKWPKMECIICIFYLTRLS